MKPVSFIELATVYDKYYRISSFEGNGYYSINGNWNNYQGKYRLILKDDFVYFSDDLMNAYNEVKRVMTLKAIQTKTPIVYGPSLLEMVLKPKVVFYGCQNGPRLISVSEGLCFNFDKLMDKQFYQKVIDAEKESDLISIRTSNSNKFIKSIGGHVGNIPYGKKRVKINSVPILINCDEEIEILNKINDLDKENKDVNTIVEYLNKNNIKKRKYSWTYNSVKNIISNKQKNDFNDMDNNVKKIKLF
jgi:hypothetical protein